MEEITRGQGQVVPSQEIQVVQSLEGGVLQDLLVREGELVKKGQVLARIRDIQFSSEERGTEAQFLSLSLKKERLSVFTEKKEYPLFVKNFSFYFHLDHPNRCALVDF